MSYFYVEARHHEEGTIVYSTVNADRAADCRKAVWSVHGEDYRVIYNGELDGETQELCRGLDEYGDADCVTIPVPDFKETIGGLLVQGRHMMWERLRVSPYAVLEKTFSDKLYLPREPDQILLHLVKGREELARDTMEIEMDPPAMFELISTLVREGGRQVLHDAVEWN